MPHRKKWLLGICIGIAGGNIINTVQWVSEANAYASEELELYTLDIMKYRTHIKKESVYPPFSLPAGMVIYGAGIYNFGIWIIHNDSKPQFCYSGSLQVNCDPEIP